MDTKKRLSEWTLAECKEYCEKRKDHTPLEVNDPITGATKKMWNYFCQDCELAYMCGCIPANWEFDTLTGGEKEIMRACGAKWVTKNCPDIVVCLWSGKPSTNYKDQFTNSKDGVLIATIKQELFPSVSCGDIIELED